MAQVCIPLAKLLADVLGHVANDFGHAAEELRHVAEDLSQRFGQQKNKRCQPNVFSQFWRTAMLLFVLLQTK